MLHMNNCLRSVIRVWYLHIGGNVLRSLHDNRERRRKLLNVDKVSSGDISKEGYCVGSNAHNNALKWYLFIYLFILEFAC